MRWGTDSLRAVLLAAATLLPAAGCGRPGPAPRQTTYPVEGRLLIAGRPAVGAQLTFNPIEAAGWYGPLPVAEVEEGGRFVARTYERADGAPAGRYVLTVTWPAPVEKDERPDLLAGRYDHVSRSPLRVEVQPGPNQWPAFQLPWK